MSIHNNIMKDKNYKLLSDDYIPNVFMSYSWTSKEHQLEVMEFATDLMEKGQMNVILDVWDARDGDDLNYFMEKNVKSPDTDFVLVILDECYKIKADNREGGVGTETVILSEEVYNHVENSKVLPIIWELDENGNPFLPYYLSSRKYFDFVNDYEDEFERLIRVIHNLPKYPKPKIGRLSEDFKEQKSICPDLKKHSKMNFSRILSVKSIDVVVEEFLNDYLNELKELNINSTLIRDNFKLYDEILNCIKNYTYLRNYFIDFFEKIIKSKDNQNLDIDLIKEFFVDLYDLTKHSNDGKRKYQHYIIYDFILRELFLYVVTIGLKNRNYIFLDNLLNSPYYFDNEIDDVDAQNFMNLDNRGEIHINDEINKCFYFAENKKISLGLGYLFISRLHNNYQQDDFVDADLLCCYISYLNFYNKEYHYDWFPFSYPYKQSRNFKLFRRLSSKNHFLKVKGLLDVNTCDELKVKIKEVDSYFGISYNMREAFPKHVLQISKYINLDKICTER